MAPALADSPVATFTIPPDRDRTEPLETPFLRLPPPTDVPSVTTTDLDALGTAAEIQLGIPHRSIARQLGSGTAGLARVQRRDALHIP